MRIKKLKHFDRYYVIIKFNEGKHRHQWADQNAYDRDIRHHEVEYRFSEEGWETFCRNPNVTKWLLEDDTY